MSKAPRVKIIRAPYTPRGSTGPGRHNIVLSFKAEVMDNSYLFIGDIDPSRYDMEIFRREVSSLGDKLLGKGDLLERSELNKLRFRRVFSRRTYRTGDNVVVPGSSLKGSIRSRLEYKFVIKNRKSYSCYISADPGRPNLRFSFRHIRFWGRDVTIYRGNCNANKFDTVCRVCDIFGAPGLSSRVDISDATPDDRIEVERIDGVEGVLDAIPGGSSFNLTVACKSFNMEDLGLLLAGMEVFTGSPVLIGKGKYRFNPKVGGRYKGGFYFGLLKFSLLSVDFVYPEWGYGEVDEVIRDARMAVDHYVKEGYLDIERGVI